jgi:hypothetical protein
MSFSNLFIVIVCFPRSVVAVSIEFIRFRDVSWVFGYRFRGKADVCACGQLRAIVEGNAALDDPVEAYYEEVSFRVHVCFRWVINNIRNC